MKLATKIKGTLIIYRTALQQNKPTTEIRQALQEALDAAWTEVWAPGNIHTQLKWQRLFPGGRKPSVEEFITTIASEMKI